MTFEQVEQKILENAYNLLGISMDLLKGATSESIKAHNDAVDKRKEEEREARW